MTVGREGESPKKQVREPERSAEELDARLDEALRATFPASDPFSFAIDVTPPSPERRTRRHR